MFSVLCSGVVWKFAIFAGLGSVCVLDLWCLLCRLMGVVLIRWSIWGRWLLGLFHGYRQVCAYCRTLPADRSGHTSRRLTVNLSLRGRACYDMAPARPIEILIGWLMHYLFAIGYALALPLFWGVNFLHTPQLWQVLLISFVLSSVLGLIFNQVISGQAAKGGRFRKTYYHIALVLAGHAMFAMAQYKLAVVFARRLSDI